MKVLFRADASNSIGTGHLIRCRSLARALRSLGADVRFCGRVQEGHFLTAFQEEFYTYIIDTPLELSIDPQNEIWLPTTEEKDAYLTKQIINSCSDWHPDWIFVDHYGLSSSWHQAIRASWPDTLIAGADDLANRSLDLDLLVDHNYFCGSLSDRYENKLSLDRDTALCLGPKFALIDPLHSQIAKSLPPRTSIFRILISLGGAGDLHLLENILLALGDLNDRKFQIYLVNGGFSQSTSRLSGLCDSLDIVIFNSLESLAPLMSSCDICIGAGGTSTWERLCLGLPTITYSLAENQSAYSDALHADNYILYLGSSKSFDRTILTKSLESLFDNAHLLKELSSKGMDLVDGLGCLRIAHLMFCMYSPAHWETASIVSTSSNLTVQWSNQINLDVHKIEHINTPLRRIDLLQIFRQSPSSQYLSSPHHVRQPSLPRVSILSSASSWMNTYIPSFLQNLLSRGHSVRWIHDHCRLVSGDVCLILSYGRIIDQSWLSLHSHNLVVHASPLPLGKGWSPMTWQILEGKTSIPITLFEAVNELDAGPIYSQEVLHLRGNELAPEWQKLQAQVTQKLCLDWILNYPSCLSHSRPQLGSESFYERRRPADSLLDTSLTLSELFPLLQVVDNEAYPAYFSYDGRTFRLRIDPLGS